MSVPTMGAMASITSELSSKGIITPPGFVPCNVHYETIMGSEAYGVSSNDSDRDVYGFCIPPKDVVFPHLAGEILGFGRQVQRFEQYQQHGVKVPGQERTYDLSIYGIVKYFQLCMENNPNMLDSLFTPRRCVLHSTAVGEMVRDSRRLFLHKGSWFKLKGYSYSQLNKVRKGSDTAEMAAILRFEAEHSIPQETTLDDVTNEVDRRRCGGEPHSGTALWSLTDDALAEYRRLYDAGMRIGKRFESRKVHGTDRKFLYHVVRLMYEAEMILTEHDLDLERHREHMKAIRRGDVSEADVREWAAAKERDLERVYAESTLRHGPDEAAIKALLLRCLEHHYGSLRDAVVTQDELLVALREIQRQVDTVRSRIS